MTSESMDCHATLSMNTPVIARSEATWQSMTPDFVDCHATLAVTGTLFKGRVRFRAWYGRLAMTIPNSRSNKFDPTTNQNSVFMERNDSDVESMLIHHTSHA
jgi:hypothetical protein